LFFDAHRVCENGKRLPGHSARVSNWEIHPVYAIDVCKFTTLTSCKPDDENLWKPMHDFMQNGNEGTRVRG